MTGGPIELTGLDDYEVEEVRLRPGEMAVVVPAGNYALIIPNGDRAVTRPTDWQGMVMFTGSAAYIFGDGTGQFAADRHAFSQVERAVAVARLRCVADIIENPQE